jgi:cell division protein FtsI/penicillin-binding protein 2
MKRAVILTLSIILLFTACVGRIAYLTLNKRSFVAEGYNSYSLTVDILQPNIYYSDFSKATNNSSVYYAVLRPGKKTVFELPLIFNESERENIIRELEEGKPIIKAVSKSDISKTKYISYVEGNLSENTINQLINKESSGLMKYLPDSIGKRKISFTVDALGRPLAGDSGKVKDENYLSSKGVQLTINREIQNIAYEASKGINSGCIIIMDVLTSSILACVSRPDSTYINKPFSLYSPGSVFKLVMCASALENGISLQYKCKGKIKVGDTVFSCAGNKKHGKQNMKEAFANSCNCYFVKLALKLGAKRIIKTSQELGYTDNTQLYKLWNINNASFPEKSELESKGQLSLLSFGQGRLLATPMIICSNLCTIANKGIYSPVRLISYELDDAGRQTQYKYNKGKSVLSEETCKSLIDYMRFVVSDGTGKSADYKSKSAGKSGTAQTGQFLQSKEMYNTWFAGIYPYDNPKYAIVIMTENGISGSVDNCPIFRTIVEKLSKL